MHSMRSHEETGCRKCDEKIKDIVAHQIKEIQQRQRLAIRNIIRSTNIKDEID